LFRFSILELYPGVYCHEATGPVSHYSNLYSYRYAGFHIMDDILAGSTRASPARITLTITSLLTLTTMSNGARQDLPQVSYIKALDIWLTFSQALIFLVLLEYSFVSYYITRRRGIDCDYRTCTFNAQASNSTAINNKNVVSNVNFANGCPRIRKKRKEYSE
ncbi:Neurotransmitter-gated ion-channel transmembrane region, partial [Cooperia oncophora]